MTLSELRSQQKRRRVPIVEIFSGVLLIIAAITFGTNLVAYSDSSNELGTDVTIGGVQVGGLDAGARLARLEAVYVDQPIVMRYEGSPILLNPSEVGFQLDTEAMQAAAERQNGVEDNFWTGFWNYLWDRPQPAIDVPLMASVSDVELNQYIQDLSIRYDRDAGNAGFDMTTGTFQNSDAYTRLDQAQTAALIRQALYEADPAKRVINLPITTTPGQAATMDTLRQAIIDYIEKSRGMFYNGQNTVVSMYVMNLNTGEEMGILPNARVLASSTIKIGTLINFFRYQITAPTDDLKFLLGAAVICSDNGAANDLTIYTGEQAIRPGLQKLNDTFCKAGAVNTNLLSLIDIGPQEILPIPDYYTQVYPTPCPGASVASAQIDTSVNTQLPSNQNVTTAADMGTMLMMIYDCAYHNSGLLSVFPDEITQTECKEIIELLKGTHFRRLLELGVPEGVTIAHKVGYVPDAGVVGDVGIVFSNGAPYIFVMYVWDGVNIDNAGVQVTQDWTLIEDVSRLVYNYFNPSEPLLQTRQPDLVYQGAACVMPYSGAEINLEDINQNRFDINGDPLPSACYFWPSCIPFDNWGHDSQ
ncbi:MAG: serine hydrolase [Chloroflexi bacterium]|nr:serine hydrolase [Chloroflexota bacterium]